MIDLIFNLIKRSYRKIRFFIRVYIIKNPETINIDKWFLSNGDKTLRLIYPLSNKSVVFDLGGFRGDWTNEIVKKYNSLIHVFEPVPEYFENIKKRFHNYSNIYVYNYGLSDSTCKKTIYIQSDGSSLCSERENKDEISVELKDISEFLKENKIDQIDLMKINIEGAEYNLLEHILSKNLVNKFVNIQIQFHPWINDAISRREAIRTKLFNTHYLTYDFPFVWENWKKI